MQGRKKECVLTEAIGCSLGLMCFSYFIQYDFPFRIIAFLALMVAAFIINRNITSVNNLKKIFGEKITFKKFLLLLIAGIFAGTILAIPYRNYHQLNLLPHTFRNFIMLAALIGCVEEIIYRGFLQEMVKEINGWFSIAFSTVSHTGYKFFLFLAPVITESVDLRIIFFWTLGIGFLFGVLRHFIKSIWLPLSTHVVFDILSYAEFVQSPWWIW